MISFVILLIFAAAVSLSSASNPITGCLNGRAVPNSDLLSNGNGVCGFGAWNSATGPGTVHIAAVNEAFFDDGAVCGQCYELYGSQGSVVVTIVDWCPASSPRCDGDAVNFVLSTEAFLAIAPNTTDVIYDLGYRQVSCDVSGDIGVQIGSSPSEYYFSITPYHTRISVASVSVKSDSWTSAEDVPRDHGAIFSWHKDQNALSFPATVTLTSLTGQTLSKSFSSWSSNSRVDFGAQFDDVPAVSGNCTMSPAEPIIFDSSSGVGNGWDDSYFFLLISQEIDTDGNLHAVMGSNGAVQFTRDGGFETSFWSFLSFQARTSTDNYNNIRVYLGTDYSHAVSVGPISSSGWTNITVSLASMDPSDVEPSIVIQNNADLTVDLWLQSVVLLRNQTVPTDPVPVTVPLPSTTATSTSTSTSSVATGGSRGTSGTIGSNGSNGSDSSSASMTASISVLFVLLLSALLI